MMETKMPKWVRKFFGKLGPGFIAGASDDDPTAIAAYTQAGAQFGLGQLWTTLYLIPLMTVAQEMSGRIGMVTGKGLMGVVKAHYPRFVLYFAVALLLISNVITIGANLGAMAASVQMLFGLPLIFWLLLITVTTLCMEVFVSYAVYAKVLKYLALTLLSYALVAFLQRPDWLTILGATLVPSVALTAPYLLNFAAILGTNLSPYLFFWQASEEVEEEVVHHKIRAMGRGVPKVNPRDFRNLRFDTFVGMLFSNLICFFIAVTAATTLSSQGFMQIETPQQAAAMLRPLAGDLSYILFALGIVGSGLLAVPVLAGSASYALSEAFGWREGFHQKIRRAHGFYGAITIATLIGILINLTPIGPMRMLIYAAALNAVLAPPLLMLILFIANNKKIMGGHTNSALSNVVGVFAVALMFAASIALLIALL